MRRKHKTSPSRLQTTSYQTAIRTARLIEHSIKSLPLEYHKDIEFKSINRSDAAEDLKTEKDRQEEKQAEPLIKRMKDVLGDDVKDVKASVRLTDSPCCIVVDEKDPTVQMQGLLKAMGQDAPEVKPIPEINPNHEIIKKLEAVTDEALFADTTRLLFDQALLIEGAPVKKPVNFVKRLNSMLGRAL